MVIRLGSNWWTLVVRAVLAVALGVVLLVLPGPKYTTLAMLLGFYLVGEGVFAVIGGFSNIGYRQRWWPVLIGGVASAIIGLLVFFWPALNGFTLFALIAVWAVFRGLFEVVAGMQLQADSTGEWMMIAAGAISVIFGGLLFGFAGPQAPGLIWLVGVYMLVYAVLLAALGLRMRAYRS